MLISTLDLGQTLLTSPNSCSTALVLTESLVISPLIVHCLEAEMSIPVQANSTQDSSYIPRGPVIASLQFFDPPADDSKAWNYPLGTEPPSGQPRRNFGDADIAVTITDIRGQESKFNLDTNAFTTLKTTASTSSDFSSEKAIKETYYPEVKSLLHSHIPEALRIVIFDHTIRLIGGDRPPVLRVHIDQTPSAAIGRVRAVLPPHEAEELLKGRVRVINVWRPLNGPVQCSPLAFADSNTVTEEQCIAVEHRYPERMGETVSVVHSDEKWYYWSGIDNEERILLECYDSEKGGRVPHTAFVDPRSPAGARQRESIEVRALVFG